MSGRGAIHVGLGRRAERALLAVGLVSCGPVPLASETLTLSTYYPAPLGVYASIITTGAGGANTLLARDAGMVGIGTGSASARNLVQVGGGAVPGGPLAGVNVGMTNAAYLTASDGARTAFIGADTSGYGMAGTLTNHDFVLRSNNTERVRVTAGGNVGIGTGSGITDRLTVFAGTGASQWSDVRIGPSVYWSGEEHTVNFDYSGGHVASLIGGWSSAAPGAGYFSVGNMYLGGPSNGTKAFTVWGNGSVIVDEGDRNAAGTNACCSPSNISMTFGNASGEGVGSNRAAGSPNRWGLDFFTGWLKRMVITNSGNVGINTATPSAAWNSYLTVNGRIVSNGAGSGGMWVDGANQQFVGSIDAATMGLYNNGWNVQLRNNGETYFGSTMNIMDWPQPGFNPHPGGNWLALDAYGDVCGANWWYIHVCLGGDNWGNDGELDIYDNPSNPSNQLSIYNARQGQFADVRAKSFNTASSRALKENIRPLDGREALGQVLRLQGVSFDYKADKKHSLGLIAEDVERIVPEVVGRDSLSGKPGSVDYSRIVTLLIEAVKTQQSEIERLKKRLGEPSR